MKNFFLSLAIAGLLFGGSSVQALQAFPAPSPFERAQQTLDTAAGNTGLAKDIEKPLGAVIKGALALVGTIFFLLTIYAGILWMTARGKEEQLETSQKIITAAVIGLFITLAAYAITSFVTSRLAGGGGAEPPGAKVTCTPDVGICVAPQAGCGPRGVKLTETCSQGYVCCKKP